MTTIDGLLSTRVYLPKPYQKPFQCTRKYRLRSPILRQSFTVLCKVSSSFDSQPGAKTGKDDFLTRVLQENPSQIEPRYLIGDKFYTSKERENLNKSKNVGFVEFVAGKLNFKEKWSEEMNDGQNKGEAVYLKDILREYKGKLYVPEHILREELSEEEEFDKNVEELPQMSFEDFEKAMENDKVKLLTYKEDVGNDGDRDFIVDLKEIPGQKSLHKTKWAMRLDQNETLACLQEYEGPLYEIESNVKSLVGTLREYPHPVASSISSRMLVEFGMLTSAMAAAAAVIGGFLASAAFAVTSFIFAVTVYIVWPATKPLRNMLLGFLSGILDSIVDYALEVVRDGDVFFKFKNFFTFGSSSPSLKVLKPIAFVLLFLVVLVRFALTKRPTNFRRWDLWQGIDFSRSKAEARIDGSTGVKFSDVAGIDEAVEELQELVRYLKNPELFDQLGIKPPHGVLLEGPPGCGKTLVAKAIAGEAGVPFYEMAGSEFVEVLVGVGSARVRDLFKRAKINKPSVIFVDEIDALGSRRMGTLRESVDSIESASTQERETTLNQLLIELDGFDTGKGVIFLAATNRRDLLDPALLRPGRFDRKIRIRAPNTKGRLEILKIHARKVKLSDSVDLSIYAKNLPGWTGAKLAQLIQEAALVAVRHGHTSIAQSDMDEAVDRLTVGPKQSVVDLGHQGQCRRATIEVGLGITSHILRLYHNAILEPCDRISIIPRGQNFSHAVFNRMDDEVYKFERRPQLLHRLQVFLSARAAEEVIYGRDTSRASVIYLAHASWLARKIITIWNLENPMAIHGERPPWRTKLKFTGPRLDFEGSLYNAYGLAEPPLNFNLDDEIAERSEKLISDMYGKTVSLLRQHHAALLKAVKVLLNQKEMSGEEIDYILKNYPPNTPLSLLSEEENPGSLPFFETEQGSEVNHAAFITSSEERAL